MFSQLDQISSLNIDQELKTFRSGCLSLYDRHFFPWGGLPYPKLHAEIGAILAETPSLKEMALKMADYQEATLDHQKKPIFSFLRQEKSYSYEELVLANQTFFKKLEKEPKETHSFLDTELGILSQKDHEKTIALFGSGCKSGLGLFLYKDVGVLNFGPELLPLGEALGFGVAGRAKNFHHSELENGFSTSFQTRLSAPHSRDTKIFGLMDSGFSGLWMNVEATYLKNHLILKAEIEGFRPVTSLVFSFFCRAQNCYVAKSQKLKPKSLDRYIGPPDEVELRKDGSLFLRTVSGFSKMEIIPLAGDESFWNADFLLIFFLNSPKIHLELFF